MRRRLLVLKRLLRKLRNYFGPSKPGEPRLGDKVGNVTIQTESQLIKHTEYKPGGSYRLGEMIVTVHATKDNMLAAIAAVDAKREAKHAALRERAIDLMLMTPKELQALKVEEWLAKGRGKHSILRNSKLWGNVKGLFRRTDYKEAAPAQSGANPNYKAELKQALADLTKGEDKPVKVKDKVTN
jgi:hypothetical protein